MPDDDDRYIGVLKVLGELHDDWRDYQARLASEITEYRKTVNSAITILGQEAISFQSDTKKRLEADATQREQRQRRADRKDLFLFGSVGCLIVVNAVAIVVLAIVLIAMQWR